MNQIENQWRRVIVVFVTLLLWHSVANAQTATLAGGVLTISGTVGRDQINVQSVSGNVVVKWRESQSSFPLTSVTRIVAQLGSGDDSFEATNCVVPCVVNGARGNDFILGGDRADVLSGGLGDDFIIGGKGPDRLFGDENSDLLVGGLLSNSSIASAKSIWLNVTASTTFTSRVQRFKADPPRVLSETSSDQFSGGTHADLFVGDFQEAVSVDTSTDFYPAIDTDLFQPPDRRRIYFIGVSLTGDLTPVELQGRVEWHLDCGVNLQQIFDFPLSPCKTNSHIWPEALVEKQFDVLVVQPHFGTTLTQDTQVISEWMRMQPNAEVIIHTGWSQFATFEETYHAPVVAGGMQHSPAYFSSLVGRLQAAFPTRQIRTTEAIQILDSIWHDIDRGEAPFADFSELYRNELHMSMQGGRYMMHNLMRLKLGQPLNRHVYPVDPTQRQYLDLKVREFGAD